MKEGIISLIVITLLFVVMYVYASSSVYMDKLKLKKAQNNKARIELDRLEEQARLQEIREEKAMQIKTRREEMQEQFSRLNIIRQELISKGKLETEKVSV